MLQRGIPLYLFATCSVQSGLKFRLPSLHPLAYCLPTKSCQRVATKYIGSFVSANSSLSLSLSLFIRFSCFFIPLRVRGMQLFFCRSGQSLSLSQFSLCLVLFSVIPFLQFVERSRFSNKHPGGAIYLLRPKKTLFRLGGGGEKGRARVCEAGTAEEVETVAVLSSLLPEAVIFPDKSHAISICTGSFLIVPFPLSLCYH